MLDLAHPLPQSEAFERTCRRVRLPVRRIETEQGSCLVQTRKLPIIGAFHLASRGPVATCAPGLQDLVLRVRSEFRGPLAINAPEGAEALGGWHMARGAELAIIDLAPPDEMRQHLHQKWRNQLKKAERSPLRVIHQPLGARRHAWFFDAEQAQQKSRKYRAYPPEFLLAFAAENKGQARLYTALLGTRPVAAMLVLKHGAMATYQAGINTDEGRQHCAHNLLLWALMTDLQRGRVRQLDLGRADLSDGLRRFKLGSGARLEQLPGTFLFHHRFLKPRELTPQPKTLLKDAA